MFAYNFYQTKYVKVLDVLCHDVVIDKGVLFPINIHFPCADIQTKRYFAGDRLGYYMYIETSSPRIENDTALLMSAPFKPVTGSNDCRLRFFYHMFGDHVKELNIWLKTSAHPYSPMKKVWAKQGKYIFIDLI